MLAKYGDSMGSRTPLIYGDLMEIFIIWIQDILGSHGNIYHMDSGYIGISWKYLSYGFRIYWDLMEIIIIWIHMGI